MTCKIVKVDGEWIVRVSVDGKRIPSHDYFASDKRDAEETATAMIETWATA